MGKTHHLFGKRALDEFLFLLGIPRSYVEAPEDYLRREAKQPKRESTPPRDLSEAYKVRPHEALTPLKMKAAHEGLVATVKEAGRSIHEIPREELRCAPDIPLVTRPLKEGSITQVSTQSGRRHREAAEAEGPVFLLYNRNSFTWYRLVMFTFSSDWSTQLISCCF